MMGIYSGYNRVDRVVPTDADADRAAVAKAASVSKGAVEDALDELRAYAHKKEETRWVEFRYIELVRQFKERAGIQSTTMDLQDQRDDQLVEKEYFKLISSLKENSPQNDSSYIPQILSQILPEKSRPQGVEMYLEIMKRDSLTMKESKPLENLIKKGEPLQHLIKTDLFSEEQPSTKEPSLPEPDPFNSWYRYAFGQPSASVLGINLKGDFKPPSPAGTSHQPTPSEQIYRSVHLQHRRSLVIQEMEEKLGISTSKQPLSPASLHSLANIGRMLRERGYFPSEPNPALEIEKKDKDKK